MFPGIHSGGILARGLVLGSGFSWAGFWVDAGCGSGWLGCLGGGHPSLKAGYWVLGTGFWVLAYFVAIFLDAGYWVLAPGSIRNHLRFCGMIQHTRLLLTTSANR